MLESRRRLLTICAGMVGAFAARSVLLGQHMPQPIPSPNAPNQNFPPGLDGPDNKPTPSNKSADPEVQREIRSDVEKLFALASELKAQVQTTDSTVTLSLSMVKTAQQIEKLAKQIKNLSKG